MEKLKINELFDIKDIRSANDDGYRERRNYDGSPKVSKPDYARFKARVTFRDGNTIYLYSLDFHNGTKNEWLGFSQLKYQFIQWHEQGRLVQAKVWVNLDDKRPNTDKPHYNKRCFSMWYNKISGELVEKIDYQVVFNPEFPDLVLIPQ